MPVTYYLQITKVSVSNDNKYLQLITQVHVKVAVRLRYVPATCNYRMMSSPASSLLEMTDIVIRTLLNCRGRRHQSILILK